MWSGPETLQQEFRSSKFRPPIEHQPNVVYEIPCADCDWCYVGETGRCFKTRKKEYIRNVKTCANGSNTARHAWSFDHRVDFDHSRVVDGGSFRVGGALEAWRTSAIKSEDGGSQPIPDQCSILFGQWPATVSKFLLCSSCYLCLTFCICFANLHLGFYPWRAVD